MTINKENAVWGTNVGTQAYPESFLHRYAIALLWDTLNHGQQVPAQGLDGRAVSVRMPEGGRLMVPTDLQPIGGCIPDLAVLDRTGRAVTVLEVIVTAPPDDGKRDKLQRLFARGVGVALVNVPDEHSLSELTITTDHMVGTRFHEMPGFAGALPDPDAGVFGEPSSDPVAAFFAPSTAREKANVLVATLTHALIVCDPHYRREFLSVLRELDSPDSLYPLSSDNPLRHSLMLTGNQPD